MEIRIMSVFPGQVLNCFWRTLTPSPLCIYKSSVPSYCRWIATRHISRNRSSLWKLILAFRRALSPSLSNPARRLMVILLRNPMTSIFLAMLFIVTGNLMQPRSKSDFDCFSASSMSVVRWCVGALVSCWRVHGAHTRPLWAFRNVQM